MLRPYLEGSEFKIRTNHQAPRLILAPKEFTVSLARRRFCLLEFDFEVVHRLGVCYQTANAILQLPKKKPIAWDQSEENILTLDIQNNDKNDMSVVRAVTHV